MDVNKLALLLEQNGWKNIMFGVEHMGFGFDVVGERRFGPTRWNVLVRAVKHLDAETVNELVGIFSEINEKSKSWLLGKGFLFCVIADSADPGAIDSVIGSSEKGMLSVVRVKGGGGNILVADISTRQVHGRVPTVPLDVAKFTKGTIGVLEQVIAQ